MDEVLAEPERCDPTVAEREPGEEIEWDRGESPPPRKSRQDGQSNDRNAEFDEHERDVHGRSHAARISRLAPRQSHSTCANIPTAIATSATYKPVTDPETIPATSSAPLTTR
jgi:hypothetical protein